MIMLSLFYPLFLNTVTYSASSGQETKLDKNMVDCELYFIRYYNQYLIFVLLKNLNTMSYLKNWFQSYKEETNTFINDVCLLSFKIFDYYHERLPLVIITYFHYLLFRIIILYHSVSDFNLLSSIKICVHFNIYV